MRLVSLRTVEYVDPDGRSWLRGLPQGARDSDAARGVPIGPPSLASLGLPKDVEIRLHNQLYQRGIITANDARRRINEIPSAIAAAYRVDTQAVLAIFQGIGAANVGSAS